MCQHSLLLLFSLSINGSQEEINISNIYKELFQKNFWTTHVQDIKDYHKKIPHSPHKEYIHRLKSQSVLSFYENAEIITTINNIPMPRDYLWYPYNYERISFHHIDEDLIIYNFFEHLTSMLIMTHTLLPLWGHLKPVIKKFYLFFLLQQLHLAYVDYLQEFHYTYHTKIQKAYTDFHISQNIDVFTYLNMKKDIYNKMLLLNPQQLPVATKSYYLKGLLKILHLLEEEAGDIIISEQKNGFITHKEMKEWLNLISQQIDLMENSPVKTELSLQQYKMFQYVKFNG